MPTVIACPIWPKNKKKENEWNGKKYAKSLTKRPGAGGTAKIDIEIRNAKTDMWMSEWVWKAEEAVSGMHKHTLHNRRDTFSKQTSKRACTYIRIEE